MTTRKRRVPDDLRLKIAVLQSGRTQRQLSFDARIGEARLSELIGRRGQPPSTREMQVLARVLRRPIADLFDVPADVQADTPRTRTA